MSPEKLDFQACQQRFWEGLDKNLVTCLGPPPEGGPPSDQKNDNPMITFKKGRGYSPSRDRRVAIVLPLAEPFLARRKVIGLLLAEP